MGKRIVVVGGSAAGPKAAARARRLDQSAQITIVQKDPDLSMASCGYPYYVGGFFDDRRQLICTPTGVVRDPAFFMKAKAITAMTATEVTEIDRQAKTVAYRNLQTGEAGTLPYDKLVLATGAKPLVPPVPGSDLEGVVTLHSLADADRLRQIRDAGEVKQAVVVGGGLIGVETCEALRLAGISVTIVEMLPQILSFLDPQLAKLVENHIVEANGAEVITGNAVAEFVGRDGKLEAVRLQDGTDLPTQLAVVAVGVRPNVELARKAGLEVERGIVVNQFMQTSDPDIYACGDCVQVPHRLTGRPVHAPFGDLANLQGRVVGENVVLGNRATFPGTFLTAICKVFDYAVGSTGLSEEAAREAGYERAVGAVCVALDKPPFMGAHPLVMKLLADAQTGKLLGFQCVGPGDVSDLPYAPPFSPAIDPLITAAHVLENKIRGLYKGISAAEVKAKLERGEKPFLLDARGPDEYEAVRLDVGEKLIPLGALRERLDELPEDKDAEIICYCKISLRGYEAARVLEANGWRNVKVMEGGIVAWPFEKVTSPPRQ